MPRDYASYYDDNYGFYHIEDEEDVAFYRTVQASSVHKRCQGCKRMVRILPDYALCNACATKLEQGLDLEY